MFSVMLFIKNVLFILYIVTLCFGRNIFNNKTRVTRDTTLGPCIVPRVTNGKYNIVKGYQYPMFTVDSDTIVSIKCKDNYGLYPPQNNAFQCKNGIYYPPLPKCIQTCPPLLSEDIKVSCSVDGIKTNCLKQDEMVENTVAIMNCKAYFRDSDKQHRSVCRNGNWNRGVIKCESECGIKLYNPTPLIFNGKVTKIGDFPWHVAVYRQKNNNYEPQYICGGSIITEKIVLSAAHCFTANRVRYPASQYYVGAGKYFSSFNSTNDEFAQLIQAEKIEIPDRYIGIERDFLADIAMVIVQEKFIISNVIRPICIDWQQKIRISHNSSGFVVGWGYSNESNLVQSEELKQLEVPFIQTDECFQRLPKDFQKNLRDDKICAGYNNGSSTCIGDSGGGLVLLNPIDNKYYISGIVSVAPRKILTCNNFHITLYTAVSRYLDSFIKSIIDNNS